MKIEILITVVFLSLLHGLIPSHWVPVMAMKKQYEWNFYYTLKIVVIISIAHILSTVLIGLLLSVSGNFIAVYLLKGFSVKVFSSVVLFLLGIYFIYKHYYHHHFHLYHNEKLMQEKIIRKQIRLLIVGMLFSPCMEITGLYFVGGMLNWYYMWMISAIYFFISLISSVFWIFFFDVLSKKINFHKIEHSSGLLSGASLIASAVLIYFI